MNTKLRVSEISKIYPGCVANDEISLEFGSGKIYALLGENGAGKSTLVKILSGVVRPDKGEVFLNDKSIKLNSPLDAKKNNIGMVFQHFNLFETLSVFENLSIDSDKKNEDLRLSVNSILKKYRKHSLVAILILSALITPPDVISQLIVSFPIYALYEFGIIIVKRVEKKRLNELN